MYLQKVEITPRMGENKTHYFYDSRLQVHGFFPMDRTTRERCTVGKQRLYGVIPKNYTAEVWVKYPCRGTFAASFSSYKRIAAHPGPVGIVGKSTNQSG